MVEARPRLVLGVFAATVLLVVACLWMGLGWTVVPSADEVAVEAMGWWSGTAILGLGSLILLASRKRIAPAMTITFWILASAFLVPPFAQTLSDVAPSYAIDAGLPVSGILEMVRAALAVLVPLVVCVGMIRVFAEDRRVRAWFNLADSASEGFVPQVAVVRSLAAGLALYVLWPNIELTYWMVLGNMDWKPPMSEWLGQIVRFSLALAFAVGPIGERVSVEAEGIRVFFFRKKYTAFWVRWSQVRFVDHVERPGRLPTFTIHYWARRAFPITFDLHLGRFVYGEAMGQALTKLMADHGVRKREWRTCQGVRAAGWGFLVLGVLFVKLGEWISVDRAVAFAEGRTPVEELAKMAAVGPLTGCYVAAMLSFGLALGLHSAYHRGGARPLLMAGWIAASRAVPDPLVAWLVWIACYAIIVAAPTPNGHGFVPSVPPGTQLEVAMTVVGLGPMVTGVGYIAGVVFGRRPLRLIRAPV